MTVVKYLIPAHNVHEIFFFISMRAKQVREVANLNERKYPHTPLYGVKEFVCLSVRLLLFWQEIIILTSPIRRGV